MSGFSFRARAARVPTRPPAHARAYRPKARVCCATLVTTSGVELLLLSLPSVKKTISCRRSAAVADTSVTLTLSSEQAPEKAETLTIAPTVIDRIWQDFAPYRAASQ